MADTKMREIDREQTVAEHEAIREMYGFAKPLAKRGAVEIQRPRLGIRPFVAIGLTLVVISGCVAAWFGFQYFVQKQEEERYIAEHDRRIAEEEARRTRTEYADIAFLDSFPPQVAISQDGRQLYARTKDGSYTELRARESTWIQNLPVREDTVYHFEFSAEGFKNLSRRIAYYDWYPNQKAGANPLQKVFRRIVLEPDMTPRIPSCATLEKIGDTDPCEWSVFREIAFRDRYAEAVKGLACDEANQKAAVASQLSVHGGLLAASGLDLAAYSAGKDVIPADLPDASKALLRHLVEHPYDLYGTITVESDAPDTRVFFMGEPLMVVKANGSMSQVRVGPDEPFTFSVYGQGRPIDISQPMSLRLETANAPAYVAEIASHQWHCNVDESKLSGIAAPPFAQEAFLADFRHYVCDYSLKVSVRFENIREIEKDAARQREASAAGAESEPKATPQK